MLFSKDIVGSTRILYVLCFGTEAHIVTAHTKRKTKNDSFTPVILILIL